MLPAATPTPKLLLVRGQEGGQTPEIRNQQRNEAAGRTQAFSLHWTWWGFRRQEQIHIYWLEGPCVSQERTKQEADAWG